MGLLVLESEPRRIAWVVPGYSPAGDFAVPAIRTLARHLAEALDITVFPLRYPRVAGVQWDGSVAVRAIGGDNRRFRSILWRALREVRREHRRHPFDLIHGFWLFEAGAVTVTIGAILRVPAVVSICGAELADLPDIVYGGSRDSRGRVIHRWVM
ncbi:MAG: glycosyltransferase, partial [Chloroflexota bacterium]